MSDIDSGESLVEFVVRQGSAKGRARCTWHEEADRTWTVTLSGPFGEVAATRDDAFEALRAARHDPEAAGWLFGLNGARMDVWPSGMAREAGGTRAYVLGPDRIGTRERLELVDVFAPADLALVTTVDRQLQHAQLRLGSGLR